MTGNLGKFSTEPAADGEGIKTKGESKREKKGEGNVSRLPDKVWEQDSKWVSRFQSEERRWGEEMEGWGCVRREAETGEIGAEVILLTESDHFIYLQQGEIWKVLFNSISPFLLRLKDQEGRNSKRKLEKGRKIYQDLPIYSGSDLFSCLCHLCLLCMCVLSHWTFRLSQRKIIFLESSYLLCAQSQFEHTC